MATYIKPYPSYPLLRVIRTEPPTGELIFERDCGCRVAGLGVDSLKQTHSCSGMRYRLDSDGNRVGVDGYGFEPRHPGWLGEVKATIEEVGIDWDAMAKNAAWYLPIPSPAELT